MVVISVVVLICECCIFELSFHCLSVKQVAHMNNFMIQLTIKSQHIKLSYILEIEVRM